MPIRTAPAVREGRKPFVYFRGTLEDARNLPPERLVAALRETGNLEPLGAFKVEHAENLKQTLLRHMDEMKEEKRPESRLVLNGIQLNPKLFVPLKISHSNSKFFIHQVPLTHWINSYFGGMSYDLDTSDALLKILNEGFKGTESPNATAPSGKRPNIDKDTPRYAQKSWRSKTFGDSYAIEMLRPMSPYAAHSKDGFVENALPNQISRVHIRINRDVTPAEAEKRKAYYRSLIQGHTIKFHYQTPPRKRTFWENLANWLTRRKAQH